MSRRISPDIMVGNEFVVPVRRLTVGAPAAITQPALAGPAMPVLEDINFELEELPQARQALHRRIFEWLHQYSVGVFALLILLVGSSATQVWAAHQSAQLTVPGQTATQAITQPAQGPNLVVRSTALAETMQRITAQPISFIAASQSLTIDAPTIQSWIKTVADQKAGVTYLHADRAAITKTLTELTAPYTKAPVNQVTATRADGTTAVIAAGKNGSQLGDINPLIEQITNNLLPAKGANGQIPIETLAFATVTPASFDKLIEVNVATKQMYLYDKGQLYKSYPISAGAPETPTLIGQFQIYSKLPVQDMRGFNANGTRYFQPHVRWIMYWAPGGYAVHGNYWRPTSWFGARNSSHGCVSLPDSQAKEVYDWATVGTTIINHY